MEFSQFTSDVKQQQGVERSTCPKQNRVRTDEWRPGVSRPVNPDRVIGSVVSVTARRVAAPVNQGPGWRHGRRTPLFIAY